jgi:hypothetical protein
MLADLPLSDPQFFIVNTKQLDYYISQFILPRYERHHDIDGAPFEIGQSVQVLNNPSNDETFDQKFVGLVGTVAFFEYDSGCGQAFPFDPMIGVQFDHGVVGQFWKEELTLIS